MPRSIHNKAANNGTDSAAMLALQTSHEPPSMSWMPASASTAATCIKANKAMQTSAAAMPHTLLPAATPGRAKCITTGAANTHMRVSHTTFTQNAGV